MLNDEFGSAPETVDEFIEDCAEWLRKKSLAYPFYMREDLIQEARIVLWKEYAAREGEPEQIAYAMHRAKQRMSHVAYRNEPQVGTRPGRRYEVTHGPSIDFLMEEGVLGVLGAIDSLNAVEVAYHHGEIMQAFDALTPKQQRYVFARFWCGMDPSGGMHMNPGMREARANNPLLKRDVLWTGNRTTKGAKEVLSERLEHLRGLART